MYLIGFPLLVIPFAIYNMIAFLTPGVGWTDAMTTRASDLGRGLERDRRGHAARRWRSSCCRSKS